MQIRTTIARKAIVLAPLAIAMILATAIACGSDTSSDSPEDAATITDYPFEVLNSDQTYTIDDLKAVQGVKANKEYDVTDLPAADAAWRILFNKHDYEVRFYPDQQTAIDEGAPYAEHVTGDNATVIGDDVLWEEGAKDRRRCSRNEKTPHAGCSYSSRYWDFVILGNMIMMCEGLESDQAIRNCEELIAQLN